MTRRLGSEVIDVHFSGCKTSVTPTPTYPVSLLMNLPRGVSPMRLLVASTKCRGQWDTGRAACQEEGKGQLGAGA